VEAASDHETVQPSRRSDILSSTWALLASEGPSRLTIRRVAAHAGVDPALIYHYFGSKRGLLDAARTMPHGLSASLRVQRGPLERLRLVQAEPWATWVVAMLAVTIDERSRTAEEVRGLIAVIDPEEQLPRLALLGLLVDRFLLHVWTPGPNPAAPLGTELFN
jgi:AcrR family transcriptional regulator